MTAEPRIDLHAGFVRTFVESGTTAHAPSLRELTELARLLSTQLPAAYVQFMRQHGPVACHSMLRRIAERGLSQPDLRQFLAPPEILKKSRDLWARQLPVEVFAFAVDSKRNAFCFRRSHSARDDAPVLLFSVQRQTLADLCESFDGLLRRYVSDLRHDPVPAIPS